MFCIALSLRLVLFFIVGPWKVEVLNERIFMTDAHGYNRIALNLLEHHIFSSKNSPPYVPNTVRTPAYPYLLAAMYAIFGYKPYIVILFQLVISSIICILIYQLGKILFNETTAQVAGLLAAFEYSSILYCNHLLTDTIFTFIFILHSYFLVKFLMTNHQVSLVYSAIFLGLATLCRPITVYFFIILMGVFFFKFRKNFRTGLLRYSILFSIFLVMLVPWMARNYAVSGKFLVSSTQEAVLSWHFPNFFNSKKISKAISSPISETVPTTNSNFVKTESELPANLTEKNISAYLSSDARRYITGVIRFFTILGAGEYPHLLGLPYFQHTKDDVNKGVIHLAKNTLQNRKSLVERLIIGSISGFLIFLYATMLLGIYVGLKKKKWLPIILFLSIIIYFALATGPAGFDVRYRIPIMPFMILLSCYGMTRKYDSPAD